ncbi:MAG: UDP-N-acetylmuramate--L-alanine ligase [Actinomycetes bacterium]
MQNGTDWQGRSLHLIGVGGAGMSGLARIAVQLGAKVSGSDRNTGPVLDSLRSAGVEVTVGHSADSVPPGADVVYSSAVPPGNPERTRALELGLSQLHRSELLGELTSLKRTVAVTGTHGKTTTTAMVVSALRGAGLDPSWYVGADLAGGEPGAGWGESDVFVVEADESDRSLLALDVEVAVLTNCELDHHATYSDLGDLEATISRFLSGADRAVVWDRPDLLRLVPEGVEVVAYDAPDAASGPGGTAFTWRGAEVVLSVPGVHNAVNASGALEAAMAVGGDPVGAVAGIERFAGTGRRFERVGVTSSGAQLVDDYAHHPTEVAATIAAARSLQPGRVVAVFQPHLYSRTEAFVEQFGEALAGADIGFLLDVYPARERAEDFPGVGSSLLVDSANRAAGETRFAAAGGLGQAAAVVAEVLRPDDICLLMGAGDIGSIAGELTG